MRVTLKDIAQKLEMNESTVSYALNGKGAIKNKTRELVWATAREMGYIPNQSARRISTGKSDEVAIVVPNVISIYGEFCQHAFQMLSDAGMRSNISISEFSHEREERIVHDLIGRGVAGVLILSTREFDDSKPPYCIDLLKKHGIAVVRKSETVSHSSVGINYHSVGVMMGKKLKERGRSRICLAAPHPPPFSNDVNRMLEGLKEEMDKNASIRLEYIDKTERDEPVGDYGHIVRQLLTENWYSYHRKLFHKIFEAPGQRPDAIVSATETCIMAIKSEAENCGLNVPEDLSLISGTRSVMSYLSPHEVTAVYVAEERIARKMVNALLEKIKSGRNTEKELLEPDFFAGLTL